MAIEINPLHPLFAAEIIGLDLRDEPSDEMIELVERAMADHAVTVIRSQNIDDEQQIRFSRAFGPLELPPGRGDPRQRIAPQLYDVSNLDRDGNLQLRDSAYAAANRVFHTDSSFNPLPTKWSLLSGRAVPPSGGNTDFIDTRAVYDALDQGTKTKIEDLIAEHSFWKSKIEAGVDVTDEMRRSMPPTPQPLIRRSANGRKALMIGSHATHIVGLPIEEGQALLRSLNALALQPHFIYSHQWQTGDLVIWDNRCTLHRAPDYIGEYKRDMRRSTINEYGPEKSSTEAAGS